MATRTAIQVARDLARLKHRPGTPERAAVENRLADIDEQAERNERGRLRLQLDSPEKVKRVRQQLAEYR